MNKLATPILLLIAMLALSACDNSNPDDTTNTTNDPGSVVINGAPVVGATLTTTVTDSDGISGTISYAWTAGGSSIGGDTDTYILTLAEVGKVITVTASYTDDGGTAESPTASTAAVTNPITYGPFDKSLIDTSQDCTGGTAIAGGTLTVGTTWTKANSPYIVSGDVSVGAGDTLTIEAGVTVCADDADGQSAGVDTAKVEFLIDGTLVINGSKTEPVIFRSINADDVNDQAWHGIIIGSNSTGNVIDYAYMTNGARAVTLGDEFPFPAADSVTISNSVFEYNLEGVDLASTGLSIPIDSCAFVNNKRGVQTFQGSVYVENSLFYGNNYGVAAISVKGSTYIELDNVTLDNNDTGILITPGPDTADVELTNVILTNSTTAGIDNKAAASVVYVSYSNLWNNPTDGNGTYQADTTVISADPQYINAPDYYGIKASSPSVDTGANIGVTDDIAGDPRPSGTYHDMGAYEYQQAP